MYNLSTSLRFNETSLTINILDADDQNPSFEFDQYKAILPESISAGVKLPVSPEDVKAFDKDKGIKAPVYYTFAGMGPDYRHFEINRLTSHHEYDVAVFNTRKIYVHRKLGIFFLPIVSD